MTDSQRTLIAVLLDRPGSIQSVKSANMDAVQIGTALGIPADRSMTWHTTGGGVVNAKASASAFVARRRPAPVGVTVEGFSQADRTAARGRTGK